MNRLVYVIATAILTTAVTSCGPRNVRPLDELTATSKEAQYLVQSGDTLNVDVWGEQRLSGERFVREDGMINMPLVEEEIKAEGKSLKALGDEIALKLKKFIPAASVSVSVVQSSPIRYFLSGQFQKPGEYRSDKKITLLQAVATGGGFAPFADESALTLIRRGAEGEMRYRMDYNRVVDGREPNPELKNGDIIAVQ